MKTNAIKLSVSTILSIILWLPTEEEVAKFSFACLTSAYNGESWYYIKPDTDDSWDVDYTKQIVTEDALNEKWTRERPSSDDNLWFTIISK